MRISNLWAKVVLAALSIITTSSQGALIPKLNGAAVYDDDRDITWLANAHLVSENTFGLPVGVSLGTHPADDSGVEGFIRIDHYMNWPGALHWIDAMNAANYLGFNDWRLPTTAQPDTTCSVQSNGHWLGFNCSGSEMGHLFYTEFGATAVTSVLDTGDPEELSKFTNIQSSGYWSGTEFESQPGVSWFFNFDFGSQNGDMRGISMFAWPVRDGDVGVIPVPPAVWLFGSGLLGLIGIARRKGAA